jgi:hypothetical protein
MLELTLTFRHQINDRVYGPGRVRVDERVADVLLESEQRRQLAEDDLYRRSARAGLILPGGLLRPVPVESLDEAIAQMVLGGRG